MLSRTRRDLRGETRTVPAKAKEELGWEAGLGITEMCEDAWRWQSKHPNGFED